MTSISFNVTDTYVTQWPLRPDQAATGLEYPRPPMPRGCSLPRRCMSGRRAVEKIRQQTVVMSVELAEPFVRQALVGAVDPAKRKAGRGQFVPEILLQRGRERIALCSMTRAYEAMSVPPMTSSSFLSRSPAGGASGTSQLSLVVSLRRRRAMDRTLLGTRDHHTATAPARRVSALVFQRPPPCHGESSDLPAGGEGIRRRSGLESALCDVTAARPRGAHGPGAGAART